MCFGLAPAALYEEIVEQRLQTIGERKVGGLLDVVVVFARRMKPALRTCVAEARQSSLSLKLARAANLLRTRVDVELEQQNQELLKSMNARTRFCNRDCRLRWKACRSRRSPITW